MTVVEEGIKRGEDFDFDLNEDDPTCCLVFVKHWPVAGMRSLCGKRKFDFQAFGTDDSPDELGMIWCQTCGFRRCPDCAAIYLREYGAKYSHGGDGVR